MQNKSQEVFRFYFHVNLFGKFTGLVPLAINLMCNNRGVQMKSRQKIELIWKISLIPSCKMISKNGSILSGCPNQPQSDLDKTISHLNQDESVCSESAWINSEHWLSAGVWQWINGTAEWENHWDKAQAIKNYKQGLVDWGDPHDEPQYKQKEAPCFKQSSMEANMPGCLPI